MAGSCNFSAFGLRRGNSSNQAMYHESRPAANNTTFCYRKDKHDIPDEKLIMLISIRLLVIILAACGNYLLMKAFYKFARLRTASNIILVSLCAADSLIAIVFVLEVSAMAMKLSAGHTHCSRICQLTAWFSIVLLAVIILHLALISVERFISVKFSLRYHNIVTKRRALFASIVVWLWAVAVTVIFPQGLRASNIDAVYDSLLQALHPCFKTKGGPRKDLQPVSKSYLIFLVTSQLIIPLAVILCSYIYIFLVSHKHRTQMREQNYIQGIAAIKHEIKGARTFGIVITVCLASILPELISTSLSFFGKLPDDDGCHPRRKYGRDLRCFSYMIAFSLNAICNPLIYGWRNEQFKSAFRTLLKCG